MSAYPLHVVCQCGHDGADHHWMSETRTICDGDRFTCTCHKFTGGDGLITVHDFQVIEDQLKTEMGNALKVTWTLQRRMLPIDVAGDMTEPPLPSCTESALTIILDAHVVESNPVITIVAGNRTFRAVEELS